MKSAIFLILLFFTTLLLGGCSLVKNKDTDVSSNINLQEISFENDCSKLSEQIKGLIEQTNYCTKDSDCFYTSFGCPFGCYTILSNKIIGAVQKINEGINIYGGKCMRCLYDCGGPPNSLSCENNKCIIKN